MLVVKSQIAVVVNMTKFSCLSADCTPRTMISYWRHNVVCPSVCDAMAKWCILHQKCLNKCIRSALVGTRRYSFQPPITTLSPQNSLPQNFCHFFNDSPCLCTICHTAKMSEQVNRECHDSSSFNPLLRPWSLKLPKPNTLCGIHYAHVTHVDHFFV